MQTFDGRGVGPEAVGQDHQAVAFPLLGRFDDIELEARFEHQLGHAVEVFVAEPVERQGGNQHRGLGDGRGAFEIRFERLDAAVGFADDVIDGGIEPAVGRHLVADVATGGVGDDAGQLHVELLRQFQAAEVGPRR